jgi:hypothetical protein
MSHLSALPLPDFGHFRLVRLLDPAPTKPPWAGFILTIGLSESYNYLLHLPPPFHSLLHTLTFAGKAEREPGPRIPSNKP